MLAAVRYERIVQVVNERGSVRVSQLSRLCQVTDETIRRDLDRLEEEGRLLRSYGGAISLKGSAPEVAYQVREITNVDEKRDIAEEAIRHIKPYDRIVLDASSTAWYMASNMPDIPLTVLTNSIKVTMELSMKPNIKVINTGGNLLSSSLSFVGPIAEKTLDEFHVNKAFISCKGVHLDSGISDSNELQARMKKRMVGMAEQVYVLADFSKFDVRAFASVSGWEGIHHIITDSKTDAEYVGLLKDRRIHVIQLSES
jgi:DeoR/GlpR family transcriptional regulator of sugar metabolism